MREMKNTESPEDLFALFGNPVAQSLSPLMHLAAYGAMGIPARYEAFQVGNPEEMIRLIREQNIRGASVTIPLKTAVMAFLDEVDEDARIIGAVNTIRNIGGRLEGFNTDWCGLTHSLRERLDIRGQRFAVLGSGGAARAAVFGIAREGGIPIVFCRNQETGKALSRDLGCLSLPLSRLQTASAYGLVNATPVGMAGGEGETPVDRSVLSRLEWVMDMIYNPLRTRLLQDALASGCGVIDGLSMFVYQGAEQIRIWTGKEPPVDIMAVVVREELLRRGRLSGAGER
jgi:shikimate dehydrogenase